MSTIHTHTVWVYAHMSVVEWVFWNVSGGVYVCLSVHVWACGCSTWLSRAWAGQSLICHPLRSTDMQPKQTDIKTERKASLCSSAVQFVLTLSGALSSPLILMSSPGIRLRRPASQWGAGGAGGFGTGRDEGWEGGDINTPTQTLHSPQHADTNLFEQGGVGKYYLL